MLHNDDVSVSTEITMSAKLSTHAWSKSMRVYANF